MEQDTPVKSKTVGKRLLAVLYVFPVLILLTGLAIIITLAIIFISKQFRSASPSMVKPVTSKK